MAALSVVVVSWAEARTRALTTVATAATVGGADRVLIVDLDDTFESPTDLRGVEVRRLPELAADPALRASAVRAYATLPSAEIPLALASIAALTEQAAATVLLSPGVIVTGPLSVLADRAADGMVVLPRAAAGYRESELAISPRARLDARLLGPLAVAPVSALLSEAVIAVGPARARRSLAEFSADWRSRPGVLELMVGLGFATVDQDPTLCLTAARGLGDRSLESVDGALTLDRIPVVTVDGRAYDPRRPWLLDAACPVPPALSLADHRTLVDVLAAYASAWDPPHGGPDQDVLLRDEARRALVMGEELPALTDAETLRTWATESVPGGHRFGVARYVSAIRSARPDLLTAFPDVPGRDSPRLTSWARTFGIKVAGVDPDLMEQAAAETRSRLEGWGSWEQAAPRPLERTPGVNLVGYLAGGLGLGESARLVDSALLAAGEPTTPVDVSYRTAGAADATARVGAPAAHDVSLLCVNSPDTARIVAGIGDLVRGSYRIGLWYWEFAEFPPAQAGGFAEVDEVWAATDFIRDALSAASPGVPVFTITPPLPQRPEGEVPPLPVRFGIDAARPWFLFTFDYLSHAVRKNPLGLIEAFVRAFPEVRPDGPQLVIKTMNGDQVPIESEQLRLACAARPDLILIEEYLPHAERHVLVAHCTAYVSLHHAEGLGLTLAEAMAFGRPVVTTAYGGPMQFVTEENAFLVAWTPGTLGHTVGPYVAGLPWAEPDLDDAARILRLIVADPEAARRVGERGARDVAERHHPQAAGQPMRARLREIRASRDAR